MQQAVLAELAQLKISLDTQIKTTNKLPDNLTLLAKHKSADLTQLLKHMFVTSDKGKKKKQVTRDRKKQKEANN